ncbi:hypothetical protein LTR86_003331 [Recurvomyces mirabilis]|nr:hypothetical protein LTR86_003331 [Recurvomyces mirabilis]
MLVTDFMSVSAASRLTLAGLRGARSKLDFFGANSTPRALGGRGVSTVVSHKCFTTSVIASSKAQEDHLRHAAPVMISEWSLDQLRNYEKRKDVTCGLFGLKIFLNYNTPVSVYARVSYRAVEHLTAASVKPLNEKTSAQDPPVADYMDHEPGATFGSYDQDVDVAADGPALHAMRLSIDSVMNQLPSHAATDRVLDMDFPGKVNVLVGPGCWLPMQISKLNAVLDQIREADECIWGVEAELSHRCDNASGLAQRVETSEVASESSTSCGGRAGHARTAALQMDLECYRGGFRLIVVLSRDDGAGDADFAATRLEVKMIVQEHTESYGGVAHSEHRFFPDDFRQVGAVYTFWASVGVTRIRPFYRPWLTDFSRADSSCGGSHDFRLADVKCFVLPVVFRTEPSKVFGLLERVAAVYGVVVVEVNLLKVGEDVSLTQAEAEVGSELLPVQRLEFEMGRS